MTAPTDRCHDRFNEADGDSVAALPSYHPYRLVRT